MAFGAGSSNYMKMKGMLKEDNVYEGNVLQLKGILKIRDRSFKKNLRVLIVDDDKVTRKVMMAMLRDLKVEGKEAVNGKEAVDFFAAGEVFTLVLMDMEMPFMNGPETTRFLRGMGVRAKLVGMSAHLTEKEQKEFLDAGGDEFYMKPVTRTKLVALLQAIDEEL
ncbi:hypothetical protein J5N97_025313 [Dioscorea zingiberensis]|nr:hypothetical protein J5N97_025313 [Dioscorea zingiberensis]